MTKTTKMALLKHIYVVLILAVFASGVGLGSLLGMNVSDVDVQTQMVNSRGLNFNTVLAEPTVSDEATLEPTSGPLQLEGPIERNSPSDWVKESQIEMRPDGVFIHLNNPQWAIFADTNSMDPVFDAGSHAIQVFPSSKNDISVGDIISYNSEMGFSIIHRVTQISEDEEGWYAITKGDNNPVADPWKIRFSQITRVTAPDNILNNPYTRSKVTIPIPRNPIAIIHGAALVQNGFSFVAIVSIAFRPT